MIYWWPIRERTCKLAMVADVTMNNEIPPVIKQEVDDILVANQGEDMQTGNGDRCDNEQSNPPSDRTGSR